MLKVSLVLGITDLVVAFSAPPESEMGPLITKEHRNKVKGYVDLGVEKLH